MDKPSSPLALAKIVEGWDDVPQHLALLDDALVKVANGEIRRLLVEMPPRHGKSETCSRFFPAWYLGTKPKGRIILTSYGTDYARTWGLKAKRVLDEYGARFGVGVRSDSKAAADWETDQGGGMVTAGIGTGITGRGANVLIIDDPVKDQEEAASETIQERNWDWYQATARTRLEPNGAVVLIQTRWHEKDLAGRILEEEGHEWTVLRLPAIGEGEGSDWRPAGAALWPERYDIAALADIRDGRPDPDTGIRRGGMSAYWWSALYQQSPSPLTGNIFDRRWWNRYRPELLESLKLQGRVRGAGFLDMAHDEKSSSDYSVLATWYTEDGARMFVKDVIRARMSFPDLQQACVDWYVKERIPLVIEETPGSLPLIQSFERLRQQGRGDVPPVLRFKIGGRSKVTKAQAASPYVEAGIVHLPYEASWVGDFIEEHAAFPNAAHDDQVDTTSMAILRLAGVSGSITPPPQSVVRKPPPVMARRGDFKLV